MGRGLSSSIFGRRRRRSTHFKAESPRQSEHMRKWEEDGPSSFSDVADGDLHISNAAQVQGNQMGSDGPRVFDADFGAVWWGCVAFS